jgi:ABC-type branched-subunit amino acid transport system substrate-binding protein
MNRSVSLALLVLCLVPLSAQQTEVYFDRQAEEFFLLGMRQYSQKEFRPALHSFRQSIGSFPENHRTTAAMMMQAKSEYALKNYGAALDLCDSLNARYPSSLYAEDVAFTRGMAMYQLGDYLPAFGELLGVYHRAMQPLNREHAHKMLEHLAAEYLSEEQVSMFITDSLPPAVRSLLTVVLAERQFQSGRTDEAKKSILRFDPASADQSLQFRVNRLLSRIEKGNLVRIGVLLPLQQSLAAETREKKIINEMLEGIRLAVSDYEERTVPGQISVELDVKDSGKDSAVIRSVIEEWAQDPAVAGIIGPVFSSETMIAARFAQAHALPIVSPTATDEGISAIGPYVFQANSTHGAKGKTMAQYAVRVLGAKTIAVLTSSVQTSATQADSFIAEAKRLGATIVTDKRFKKGETDIRSYVRAIRAEASALRPDYVVSMRGKINVPDITRKLVSLGVKFSYIDSVIATGGNVNFTALFGDSAKRIVDSLHLPVKKTAVYVDSLQYPVSTIDVVYCPISNSHEIGVITSQLTFYNIRSVLLGSGDWNDANELDLNKRYADGAIFGVDRWIERNDRTVRITSRYSQRYSKQVTDNVLFGYDAMAMVIRQFAEGALTRDQLAEALTNVFEVPGVRNAISLKPERVNSALNILQFKDGAVTKLRTYSYQ